VSASSPAPALSAARHKTTPSAPRSPQARGPPGEGRKRRTGALQTGTWENLGDERHLLVRPTNRGQVSIRLHSPKWWRSSGRCSAGRSGASSAGWRMPATWTCSSRSAGGAASPSSTRATSTRTPPTAEHMRRAVPAHNAAALSIPPRHQRGLARIKNRIAYFRARFAPLALVGGSSASSSKLVLASGPSPPTPLAWFPPPAHAGLSGETASPQAEDHLAIVCLICCGSFWVRFVVSVDWFSDEQAGAD